MVYLSREEVLQVEDGRHTDHQTDPQQDHIDDPELEKRRDEQLTRIDYKYIFFL